MLALTDDATAVIDAILHDPAFPASAGLRIAREDRVAGHVAGNDLTVAVVAGPASTDQVIDHAGARVFIEEQAIEFLDDKLLNAQADGEDVRFELLPRP